MRRARNDGGRDGHDGHDGHGGEGDGGDGGAPPIRTAGLGFGGGGAAMAPLAFLLLAIVLTLGASPTTASAHVDALRDVSRNSGGLVSIDEEVLQYVFNLKQPRDFSLVLLVQPNAPECTICRPLRSSVESAALAYKRSVGPPLRPNLFFMEVDLRSFQAVVHKSAVSGPQVLFLPAGGKGDSGLLSFEPSAEILSGPRPLLRWLENCTNIKLAGTTSGNSKGPVWPFPLLIVVVTLAALSRGRRDVLISTLNNPMIWFSLALAVYFTSISGMFFNVIRGAPLIGYNPYRRVLVLFAPGTRSQFIGEGFITALFNVVAAALLIALTRIVPSIQDNTRRISLSVVFITVLVLLINWIWVLFGNVKQPGYPLHL